MSMVSPYVVKSENGGSVGHQEYDDEPPDQLRVYYLFYSTKEAEICISVGHQEYDDEAPDQLKQYIPASQRADGTWRKARKVKDGYIPQDEVPIYQSKGKQWAAGRTSYPVGLDPSLIREKELKEAAAAEKLRKQKAAKKVVVSDKPSLSTTGNKTTPVKEIASKQTAPKDQPKLTKEEPFVQVSKKHSGRSKNEQKKTATDVPTNAALDPIKKLRNLKKKLKDVESLEAKIASNEVKNPDKDQLEKVRRKAQLQDEILAIELSLTTISQ